MTKKRHWSDDKRATDGDEWRRARESSGVPLPPPPLAADITQPHALLDRPLSMSQIENNRKSERSGGDPATVADILKVLDVLTREKSESRERDAAYQAVIQSPHEVASAMAKKTKWFFVIVTAITGAGTGVNASGVLAPSTPPNKTDGIERYRVEQAERDILRIDNELREVRMTLGRRGSIDRPSLTLPAATKGPFP